MYCQCSHNVSLAFCEPQVDWFIIGRPGSSEIGQVVSPLQFVTK